MKRRSFLALTSTIGSVLAVVVTFPLVLHLRSQVLEDGSFDAYQFLWNVWWVAESLVRQHVNPFFTRYLFYPDGAPLVFHTYSFSLGLVSVPLQLAFGLVAAHNLLVLAAPGLAFFTTALLAHRVTHDEWAAVAAGLIAALNPIALWFVPVLYLNCGYLIAALLWAWWRLQDRQRISDVALVSGLATALIFASQEFGVMGLALLLLDSMARATFPRAIRPGPLWWRGTIAAWTVIGTGLVLLALMAGGAPAELPPLLHVRLASGFTTGFLTPPWLVAPYVKFWTILYLGTVPLLLLPVAWTWAPRPAAFWTVALLGLVSMAHGPYLHLHHPLPDLQLPPEGIPEGRVPGPYLLATTVVPLLRFFRTPYRWVVGAQVVLAVLAGVGLAGVRRRLATTARRRVTAALLGLIVLGACVDGRTLRAPLAPAAIPPAYATLIADPEPAAVLELPAGFAQGTLALYSSLYMYYQTAHRKFLLDGTLSRKPLGRHFVWEQTITDFTSLPYIKYVIIHRDLLTHAYPAARRQVELLAPVLAVQGELITREGGLEVHRLHTFRAESVR